MIKPQLMQNSSLKIMHMNGIFIDIITKLIGFTVTNAKFYTHRLPLALPQQA